MVRYIAIAPLQMAITGAHLRVSTIPDTNQRKTLTRKRFCNNQLYLSESHTSLSLLLLAKPLEKGSMSSVYLCHSSRVNSNYYPDNLKDNDISRIIKFKICIPTAHAHTHTHFRWGNLEQDGANDGRPVASSQPTLQAFVYFSVIFYFNWSESFQLCSMTDKNFWTSDRRTHHKFEFPELDLLSGLPEAVPFFTGALFPKRCSRRRVRGAVVLVQFKLKG